MPKQNKKERKKRNRMIMSLVELLLPGKFTNLIS